jgi:glycosyltransferase involved in cell wall biosynthesis
MINKCQEGDSNLAPRHGGINKNSHKIVIDARMFGVGNAGIGRSIEELVLGLMGLGGDTLYYLFLTKDNFDLNSEIEAKLPIGSLASWPENWQKVLVDARWYTLKEQWLVLKNLWKIKPDLVYFPHFNVPLFYFGKYVITIHDLIWLKYPRPRNEVSTLGPILYPLKNFFSKIIFYSAVKRASKIIVPTNFTKQEILEYFKIAESRIEVVNWGTDARIMNYELRIKNKGIKEDKDLKKCYNIIKPYFLYVGSAYPHKNLEILLYAFKELDLDMQLVLVGKESFFYKKIKNLVKELQITDKVIFAGFVKDEDLNVLYQSGLAFVFPSLIEGFGFPPLEAMTCGLPVISSNSSCLPEILGSAVIYFDPRDKEDLKQSLLKVINSPELREELVKKGYEKIKEYSWEKCVREYERILRNN